MDVLLLSVMHAYVGYANAKDTNDMADQKYDDQNENHSSFDTHIGRTITTLQTPMGLGVKCMITITAMVMLTMTEDMCYIGKTATTSKRGRNGLATERQVVVCSTTPMLCYACVVEAPSSGRYGRLLSLCIYCRCDSIS